MRPSIGGGVPHPQDRLPEHARPFRGACGGEEQQRDREAVDDPEKRDRDAPSDDRDAKGDTVARHPPRPSAGRAREQ
jgi:hypothetical protein